MKLTEEQKRLLANNAGDSESIHALYDDFMQARLAELDPEFVADLNAQVEGVEFWYA